MKEEWKSIPGFSKYNISDQARIKNLSGKILKPYERYRKDSKIKTKDCCTVYLTGDSGKKTVTVHSLVLLAFEGPCPDGCTIDHIDRDPFNNWRTNLRYATGKTQTNNRSVIRKVVTKLSMEDLDNIYERYKTEHLSDIAKSIGMTKQELWQIMRYVHPLF